MRKVSRRRKDVILLKDLAPVKEVKGGTGKHVFGESLEKQRQLARQPGKRAKSQERSKG